MRELPGGMSTAAMGLAYSNQTSMPKTTSSVPRTAHPSHSGTRDVGALLLDVDRNRTTVESKTAGFIGESPERSRSLNHRARSGHCALDRAAAFPACRP